MSDQRLQRGDVHRHVFQHGSRLLLTGRLKQHARLAVVVRVSTHGAFRAQHPAEHHLFADLAHRFVEQFAQLDSRSVRSRLRKQFFGRRGTGARQ